MIGMKKILVGIMLCVSGVIFSQTDTSKTIVRNNDYNFFKNSVGFEIKNFADKQRTSMGLQLIGATAMTLGGYHNLPPMMYVGGGLIVVGLAVNLISYTHLDNAAILLDERGVGLAIKIK